MIFICVEVRRPVIGPYRGTGKQIPYVGRGVHVRTSLSDRNLQVG